MNPNPPVFPSAPDNDRAFPPRNGLPISRPIRRSRKARREDSPVKSAPASAGTVLEPGILPVLLALMTRTLSSVTRQLPKQDLDDPAAGKKLLAVADEALLAQMMELACVPYARRQRYWRCLLEAQAEDKVLPFPVADPNLPPRQPDDQAKF